MRQRYPAEMLYKLRNDIPIARLIADVLDIPNKLSEGYVRFLCPLCGEFNTATNPKTNLARCFRCQRNFNPIDIVMLEKRMNFVQAVQYLSGIVILNHDPMAPIAPNQDSQPRHSKGPPETKRP